MIEITLTAFANFVVVIDPLGVELGAFRIAGGAPLFLLALTGIGFLVASPIMAVLGVTGVHVFTRVLSIILAAFARNNIIEGLRASFPVLNS
jgi:small neutral amino acid transporter SnatA (MarC family)